MFSSSKLRIPTPEAGAAGPRHADGRCPSAHAVNGAPLARPFPAGLEQSRCSAWAASGAPSGSSGRPRRLHDRGRLCRRLHAEPDVSGSVLRAAPGTPRSCWWCSIPTVIGYDELLKVFWESHDPTQGMRQGNDVGTQYRSAIYTYSDAQREAAVAIASGVSGRADARGLRRDHDGDSRGAGVLLRRGLPPAVPGQESRTGTAVSAAPGVTCPIGVELGA